MSELKPCPFCGGVAQMGINKESTVREYFVGCMNCHIRLYKIGYKRFYTEAEAITAWNTRSHYYGYEQAAIEAWENIKKWNTRSAGTCEWLLEHSGTLYDKWRCSKCGYLYVDSRTDGGATGLDPNYCPNCGCKVVDA